MTPNDPKLSDRGVRRGTCTVGGKAAAEAGAVTHGAVRVMRVGKERIATAGKRAEKGALFNHEKLPAQTIHRHATRHAHPAAFAAAETFGI